MWAREWRNNFGAIFPNMCKLFGHWLLPRWWLRWLLKEPFWWVYQSTLEGAVEGWNQLTDQVILFRDSFLHPCKTTVSDTIIRNGRHEVLFQSNLKGLLVHLKRLHFVYQAVRWEVGIPLNLQQGSFYPPVLITVHSAENEVIESTRLCILTFINILLINSPGPITI